MTMNKSEIKIWASLYKINILSPQFSTDKGFDILQVFVTVGGDYISYYSRRDKIGNIEYSLGADFDYGISGVDSTGTFVNISLSFIYYNFFQQDERIIADKSIGYFSI